ncbi:Scaffold protein [Pseudomonas cichorii]|uniref:Scaffold protein n=1 Tax=Pseudomonas cichorii TaxID=36746 RepID=A0A3M4M4W6_PSECI|nr:GPO family capsid scaffolding protein [Pseudomonas cichorii]RMQ48775.1 Scaffold protein [Pseudomonas cichorii]
MPRSLVSYWKRVATSGPTCDGREILPQHLREMAETYTPVTYTAVIWCDHERWPGSHGTVYALRLIEDAEDLQPGQVALEAQLKPNDKLLWLNDQGEKLFTSVEITPNFANTGKAYLTGLAVTDEPASLGTQELYFSKRTSKAAYFAASVELGALGEDKPKGEAGMFEAMFTRLFQRFGLTDSEDTTPTTESKPEMDEATATGLKALRDQLMVILAGLDAVIETAAADAPEPDASLIEPTQQAVDDIVSAAEKDAEFRRNGRVNKSLIQAFNKLQGDLDALKNAPVSRVLQRNAGPVGTPQKKTL